LRYGCQLFLPFKIVANVTIEYLRLALVLSTFDEQRNGNRCFGTATKFGSSKYWFPLSTVQFPNCPSIPSQVEDINFRKLFFYGFPKACGAVAIKPATVADEADNTVLIPKAVSGVAEGADVAVVKCIVVGSCRICNIAVSNGPVEVRVVVVLCIVVC